MPIYEYVCSVCGHRADILHGVHDTGPNFCPACGSEGSMRKAIVPPTIVFKGSGWAKRDRRSSAVPTSGKPAADGETSSAEKPASADSPGSKGGSTKSGSSEASGTGSGSTGDGD